ncbi:MAG: MarR family transcriptional regulator [Planctomycetes bacterium]|nr:MarR family transcriptional regulator [Planctomycetota bacterium]
MPQVTCQRIVPRMKIANTTRSPMSFAGQTDAEAAFGMFWRTAARLRRLAEVRFAACGLSPAQWRVMRALHEHSSAGGSSVRATDLCQELLLTKATVSGLVKRLLRMGLVTRSKVAIDQRAWAVALTAAGTRLVESILVDHPAWTSQLMEGLHPRQQRGLTQTLFTLCRWLDPLVERTGGVLASRAPEVPERTTRIRVRRIKE